MGEEIETLYQEYVRRENGQISNPVTGELLDVFEQCVSLKVEGYNHLDDEESETKSNLVDSAAFEDCLSTFSMHLPLGLRVWRSAHGRTESGVVHRVNNDGTYDLTLDDGRGSSSFFARKQGIIRDVSRTELETAPLLVLGEPAGGKTTFAKQLVCWTLRKHQELVPVLIRVCDVARHFADTEIKHNTKNIFFLFLGQVWESKYPGVPFAYIESAFAQKKLVLVLDGLDEAGAFAERMEIDIAQNTSCSLVVTSRDSRQLESSSFSRFRRVRVLQLDKRQIAAIALHRLGPARSNIFLDQLHASPALRRMAVNPLLLSVTLAVYDREPSVLRGGQNTEEISATRIQAATSKNHTNISDVVLNRGLVYSVALDSMLDNSLRDPSLCLRARKLFRIVAFIAHKSDTGKGTRDFDDNLIKEALSLQNDATLADWYYFAEAAQRGRLPLLTWYSANAVDKYRFAHLTFQEFLCAEYCHELWLEHNDNFPKELKMLIMGRDPKPASLFARGWWQQVVQMLSDLMSSNNTSSRGLGQRLLLEEDGSFSLSACVGDTNAVTLAALLRDATGGTVHSARASDGGLGASGISILFTSHNHHLRRDNSWLQALCSLDLSGNLLTPEAGTLLATALKHAAPPLKIFDVAWNRLCIGSRRRQGYERETFHSRLKCRGTTTKNKIYLDYLHAAWIPDTSGLEALLEYCSMAPELRTFDCRSNGLTVQAGKLLARTFLNPATQKNLKQVCGIELSLESVQDFLNLGPQPESRGPLALGQVVMARLRHGNQFHRTLYEARVLNIQANNMYEIGYLQRDVVVRIERNVPRRMIQGSIQTAPHRRLEAGGAWFLAEVIAKTSTSLASVTHVDLSSQALAFDVSVWNAPSPEVDIALAATSMGEEQEEDIGETERGPVLLEAMKLSLPSDLDQETETGINPEGILRLLEVLARRMPALSVVDLRDSIDMCASVGTKAAETALSCGWKRLGLGSTFLDVQGIASAERVRVTRKVLKDAGLAAIATLARRATKISCSTSVVSSRALQRVMEIAGREEQRLRVFNDVDLAALLQRDAESLQFRGRRGQGLDRASARLVISCIASFGAPRLKLLDLSYADLMPSAHPHPRTPELFGSGHLCNACATHHTLSIDLNLACQVCDNDACGAAWRSGDIVEALALALQATPCLENLALHDCYFSSMDGATSAAPFGKLGAALSNLKNLRYVDLRNNCWTGPKLTRWCAESINNSKSMINDDISSNSDSDADDTRGQQRWRRQQQLAGSYQNDDSDEERQQNVQDDEDSDEERDDPRETQESHAYSRRRLPIAAGWLPLARGLARCATLDRVDIDTDVSVHVTGLSTAAVNLSSTQSLRISDFVQNTPENENDNITDVERHTTQLDLAALVLLVETLRYSPRLQRIPPRLNISLQQLPLYCQQRAQQAIVPLVPVLDELTLGPSLYLPLAELRAGTLNRLSLSVTGSERSYGLIVAAAIEVSRGLSELLCLGLDFGPDTEAVVRAAQRSECLKMLNCVTCGAHTKPDALSSTVEPAQRIMDVGASLLAARFSSGQQDVAGVTKINLSRTGLTPSGVATIVSSLSSLPGLEVLDLSSCDIGECGVERLASYLRQNRTLRTLCMVKSILPLSTSPGMRALGLALEANSTLAELDLRTRVPAKLADSLLRTFRSKQCECALPYASKLAFLFAVRCRGLALNDYVLRAIFDLAKTKRKLSLERTVPYAISDRFRNLSPEARDLIDRMDHADLNISRQTDIHEINTILTELSDSDQNCVRRAYQMIARRRFNMGGFAIADADQANVAHVDEDDSDDEDHDSDDDDDSDHDDMQIS